MLEISTDVWDNQPGQFFDGGSKPMKIENIIKQINEKYASLVMFAIIYQTAIDIDRAIW